jgi:electron transfer flavoprotein beta subunit
MNILVCLKQILDPEIPPRDFKVDTERLEAQRGSAALVMNIFCANALETALQFREQHGGKITALSFGEATAEEVLRKALALRVDNAVLVTQDKPGRVEPMNVARALNAAVRKLGGIDLILVGRESGDWGEGQTGGLLAEELGCPCISFAEQIAPSGPAALKVRRQTDNGIEVLEATTPLVVTVTNHEGNVPRIAKTRDVMMAFRQPLTRWSLADMGLDPSSVSAVSAEVVGLTVPHKESRCEFVAGETLEERVTSFAERIITVLRSA